jgi:hypothetical protein
MMRKIMNGFATVVLLAGAPTLAASAIHGGGGGDGGGGAYLIWPASGASTAGASVEASTSGARTPVTERTAIASLARVQFRGLYLGIIFERRRLAIADYGSKYRVIYCS